MISPSTVYSFSFCYHSCWKANMQLPEQVRTRSILVKTIERGNSSENARRGIVLLGQVPPTPPLTFVSQSRQMGKVGARFSSENRLRPKLGEDPCPPGATIPQH